MKLRHTTFILTSLLAGTMHASMQSADYPYEKALKLQAGSNPTVRFGSFTADEELFENLTPRNDNLRIIDSNDTETPFLMRVKKGERETVHERSVPFEKLSFKKLPDNRIGIVIKNTDKRNFKTPLQSIVLSTSIKNYEKNVSVYSSNDQQNWKLITGRKPIFDYSKYINIRNSRISFKATTARYFKIEISNITEKQESPFTRLTRETRAGKEFSAIESSTFTRTDFKINEIYVYEKTTRLIKDKVLKRTYTSSNFQNTTEDKQSLITFSTANTPITSINLKTETPYYYRRYTLETSSDAKSWKYAHSGVISSVNNNPDSKKQRAITIPHPIRAIHYRITIQNNDSPPLDISGVELEGETQEIVFYCDQDKDYRVIYGAEQIKAPIYDIAHVLTQTKSDATATYKAEEQSANPEYGNDKRRSFFLSRKTIMIIAVFLMIIVLGWLIAKTAKSIGE
jgi:hypothetical protein